MTPKTPNRTATPNGTTPTATRGVIELICGCMFSGKTTQLLDALSHEPADVIALFKHHRDDRYGTTRVVTHTGSGRPAIHVCRAADILEHVGETIEVVAIDEGHFYDRALPEVCRKLAQDGKRVIVTALDLDMWGLPLETIERLRALADVVRVRPALCARCGGPATLTFRKTPLRDRNLVGGSRDFEPRCRSCWSPPDHPRITPENMA